MARLSIRLLGVPAEQLAKRFGLNVASSHRSIASVASPSTRNPAPASRGTRPRGPADKEEDAMNTYAILRRSGWQTPEDLREAAERSARVGNEEMPTEVRWIRSYVLGEEDGHVGTVCIYQAESPDAIREHASRAFLPVDEIVPVADTVVVREDPQPPAAS